MTGAPEGLRSLCTLNLPETTFYVKMINRSASHP